MALHDPPTATKGESAGEAPPHWQLTSIFPGLESEAYRAAKAALGEHIAALERTVEGLDARGSGELDEVEACEALLEQLDATYGLLSDLNAYLTGFIATDAFDERAQAERSGLQPLVSKLDALAKRATAWFGRLELEPLLERSALIRAHRYLLERARIEAAHLMGDEAEALASALEPTGSGAWARLHGNLISRSTTRAALPGDDAPRERTLSDLKTLQQHPDETVREAALEAELELLSRHEVAYAAALNSIKGEVNELCARRGWASALELSLFQNAITASSLEAMHQAVRESFPEFRRYLKAKAHRLGKAALGWSDLFAPVTDSETRLDWASARRFVTESFASYSTELSAFAEHAFASGWIDAPPRPGKRNGAFCMGVPGRKESRVLLNFGGTLDDAFTIAHELGHAYHNAQKYRFGRTVLQGATPMTLAETASIFCETIVTEAALARAEGEAKLGILEQTLRGATQLVVDIHARFLFEQAVFEARKTRELSARELRSFMLSAQAETYGEALLEAERHPLMWAHKGHYYSARRSFYNYPYTFGYLFGLGLYAQYRLEPEQFRARYDELLASTGLADAATVAQWFGIDIESVTFWRESLAVAAEQARAYERLVDEL